HQLDQLFGYEAEELLQQNIDVLVPSGVRGHHSDLCDAFFERPSPRAMGSGRDLRGVSREGREIPVEIGLTPIASSVGSFVLATVIDITARQRTEAVIREKNQQLSRLNEELSQFAY